MRQGFQAQNREKSAVHEGESQVTLYGIGAFVETPFIQVNFVPSGQKPVESRCRGR